MVDHYMLLEPLYFQLEQAHWFYEDFLREQTPSLPGFKLQVTDHVQPATDVQQCSRLRAAGVLSPVLRAVSAVASLPEELRREVRTVSVVQGLDTGVRRGDAERRVFALRPRKRLEPTQWLV
jgi:hypothetical protein